MQAEADNLPPGIPIEESDMAEDHGNDNRREEAGGATSDFEPSSEDTSTFGSVTSSINEHVWEYGRYVRRESLTSFSLSPYLSLSL